MARTGRPKAVLVLTEEELGTWPAGVAATLDDHQGDASGEHEFVNGLSPRWSLLAS
jgi:hypothetical protein